MTGLPGCQRTLTTSLTVWIQFTTNEQILIVGQTDGQTDTGRQQRPRLPIASRGKNNQSFLSDVVSSQPHFKITGAVRFGYRIYDNAKMYVTNKLFFFGGWGH